MSLSSTKGFTCARCRQKPADITAGASKCHLGTRAKRGKGGCTTRVCKLCKCLSTRLLGFLGKYGRAVCQTARDPSSPTTLPQNALDSPKPAPHQIAWATSAIEINTKQGITEDLHMPFSLLVSPGFEARTSRKELLILSHPKCKLYLGELKFSSFITA